MNDIVNSEMSEYWNGDGGRKWVHFQDRIDASLIPFGQQAMAAAEIVTGERVLDIGCGCGDTSFEIARRVGPDLGRIRLGGRPPVVLHDFRQLDELFRRRIAIGNVLQAGTHAPGPFPHGLSKKRLHLRK